MRAKLIEPLLERPNMRREVRKFEKIAESRDQRQGPSSRPRLERCMHPASLR